MIKSEFCSSRLQNFEEGNMWLDFSQLAKENNACSLGSGTPDLPLCDALKEELQTAAGIPMTSWYPDPKGHKRLSEEISKTYSPRIGRSIDIESEIQVTIGAYQGIFWTFQAFVDDGDEVIVFDPAFNGYITNTPTTNSKIVSVELLVQNDGWSFDRDAFANSFTTRTKMLVLNSPHNPTGKVFSREELEYIAELCKLHDVIVLSDEVYEEITFKGHPHISIASLPGMWERTITVCSAGKMFAVTGWRLGWAYGAASLIKQLFKICTIDTFGCPTVLQEAMAGMLSLERQKATPDSSFLVYFRDLLTANLAKLTEAFQAVNMPVLRAEGGFFLIVDHTRRSFTFQSSSEYIACTDAEDVKVSKWIIKEFKLVILPLSLFYHPDSREKPTAYLRVCFAKSSATIDKAVGIIRKFY